MIEDWCAGVWDFFFPSDGLDDLVLTRDEKNMIVTQINEVKSHLNSARAHINDENFEDATDEVVEAINVSTCSKCKKKMITTAHDINHAQNICELDGERCMVLKSDIDHEITDFMYNYLPKVEEVLRAKEIP